MIVVELAGEVVAKGRPRFVMIPSGDGMRNRPIAYTPKKTRSYENDLRLAAQLEMNGRPLLQGPLAMRVTVSLPIPRSWSKKKQRDAALGISYPVTRPDLDNYEKTVQDALNLVVYGDDSQIVERVSRKQYSDRPGLRIEITELANDERSTDAPTALAVEGKRACD